MKIIIKKPNMKVKVSLKKFLILQNCYFSILKFFKDYIFLLLSIFWAVVIFLFSNQSAIESSSLSGEVYSRLSIFPFSYVFVLIPIRKCAHIFLYFVLSIFLFLYFREKFNFSHILSIIVCYFYACLDEFHQYFVPGRSSLFTDTLYDLSGAIIGVIFVSIIFLIYKYTIDNGIKKRESIK